MPRRAKTVFSKNGARTHGHQHAKKNQNNNKPDLGTDFTLFTKINAKSITDLNVKYKTVKLLEDNTGKNLHDLWYGSYFLDIIPKA